MGFGLSCLVRLIVSKLFGLYEGKQDVTKIYTCPWRENVLNVSIVPNNNCIIEQWQNTDEDEWI